MNWTINTSQLETGMLIRRPGLDESLPVLQVRGGQAKIKLPSGKTSTIPMTAEVEWTWPDENDEASAAIDSEAKPTLSAGTQTSTIGIDAPDDWQTDWSLLSTGAKISVLGESGEFTVLRLSDSSARIKSNSTGQIQPMSIGHKFKVIESGKSEDKPKHNRAKSRKVAPAAAEPSPETETPDAREPELTEPTPLPTDDETDSDPSAYDPDETSIDPDDDDSKEDDDMNSTPSTPTSLLTLVEIAGRTGISYPTLNRYARDHAARLPSEGSGRKRRFYPEAIEVFREIRGESKRGGKPGTGRKRSVGGKRAAAGKRSGGVKRSLAARQRNETSKQPEITASARHNAKGDVSSSQTIDSMLVSAIDHAEAQILGLRSLIDNLNAQREQLKLWS